MKSRISELEQELENIKLFGQTIQNALCELVNNGFITLEKGDDTLVSWFVDHGFKVEDATITRKYGHIDEDESAYKVSFNFKDSRAVTYEERLRFADAVVFDCKAAILTSDHEFVKSYGEKILGKNKRKT